MSKDGKTRFYKEKIGAVFPVVFFISCAAVLLFVYRLGSLRIDKGQTPGLRDIGTYFSGGIAILQGENPYENSNFRIGPTGGLLFGIIAKLTPDLVAATLVMAISIFGFMYFVCFFAGYRNFGSFPWFFMSILIFISSQRENLVNIQITGILALFAAIGFKYMEKSSIGANLVSVVFLALALETKPHLLGLFILVKLLESRKVRRIMEIFVAVVISHLVLSIYTGHVITLEWFKLLFDLGSKATQDSLPERIAFDSLFKMAGVPSNASAVIMMCVFVIASLVLIRQSTMTSTYHVGLMIPSLGIFFHYYDLALAFGLFLAILYKQRHFKALTISFGLYVIPQNFGDYQNIVLITLLLLMLSLSISKNRPLRIITYFSLGLISWLTYIAIIRLFVNKIDIHELSMSFSIVYAMVGGVILICTNSAKSTKLINDHRK